MMNEEIEHVDCEVVDNPFWSGMRDVDKKIEEYFDIIDDALKKYRVIDVEAIITDVEPESNSRRKL